MKHADATLCDCALVSGMVDYFLSLPREVSACSHTVEDSVCILTKSPLSNCLCARSAVKHQAVNNE